MASNTYKQLRTELRKEPRAWLVTGAAGFIGSNLVETLLQLDQRVVGFDNYVTGHATNLKEVSAALAPAQRRRFRMIEGDIVEPNDCRRACRGVDYVLHQAALGSVPWSIEDPLRSHANNVTGFVNMLVAARESGVRRVVYASSSAVYGDDPAPAKKELQLGRPLSPYAVTKYVDELYAEVFGRCYGMETIGLRYFNVFGRRQDPDGAYAAVIPKWIAALIKGEPVVINGDGKTSRDFCYIDNVVQANLLAATTQRRAAVNRAYNVAVGQRTDLNQLFALIRDTLASRRPELKSVQPRYQDFRAGDVRHSLADIAQAVRFLGYQPTHSTKEGLAVALDWYLRSLE